MFTDNNAISRLIREYETHGNLVIGFDFDNTIYDYHNTDLDCSDIIYLLQVCSRLNFTMCLWSISSDNPGDMTIEDKVKMCKDLDIKVDYVNSSPIQCGKEDERKPFFSILLDDRAGLESAYYCLKMTLYHITM